MFKKILSFVAAVVLAGTFAGSAHAQNLDNGKASFGFNYAAEYNLWQFKARDSVAAGAVVVTVRGDPYFTTSKGKQVYPIATNAPLSIDVNGAHPEVLTPSAVTCNQNTTQSNCVFSVTTIYAHTGNFTISSGTYGLQEAINDLPAAGGTVVVANAFAGSTTTITTTVTGGASTVNVLDVRNGAFQFYAWSGSAYAASTSPFNTTTTANADVTSAVGAPFFYTGGASATTNYGIATFANQASTAGAKIGCGKTRSTSGSADANTIIVTGDVLCNIDAFGADGASYVNSAGIQFVSTGTIASTRIPSLIKFYTGTDASPTVKTLSLTLGADQSATFAAGITATTGTFSGAVQNTGTLTMAGTAVINKTSGSLTLQTTTSGNVVLAPATAATAATTTAARFEMAQGAAIASGGGSCVTGDCTLGGDGNFFVISGTTAVDGFATAGWQAGSVVIIETSGSITFNDTGTVAAGYAAMKLVGGANVSMTSNDLMMLVYDGTVWNQMAPTLVK